MTATLLDRTFDTFAGLDVDRPGGWPDLVDVVEATTRREFIVGAAALSALVLGGCGDDESTSSDSSATTAGSTPTVEDAFGSVEVPADPQRVVADAVSTYAHLMSIGVTPVGVALPEGISPDYIGPNAGEVTNVVADDGWTISIERALTLDPDLIVAVGADYNEEYCENYKEAVATFCFVDHYDTGTDEDVKKTLRGIATAVGREEEAEAAIADYEAKVEALRERVEATDLPTKRVGIVRVDSGGFVGIRTMDPANGMLAALGLQEPEWPEATVDGYVELSLETLGTLDDADILLVTTDDDVVIEDSVVFTSPLWDQLAVVQEDRVHFVGAWNGSDLPQLELMLDDVDTALVTPAESGS